MSAVEDVDATLYEWRARARAAEARAARAEAERDEDLAWKQRAERAESERDEWKDIAMNREGVADDLRAAEAKLRQIQEWWGYAKNQHPLDVNLDELSEALHDSP